MIHFYLKKWFVWFNLQLVTYRFQNVFLQAEIFFNIGANIRCITSTAAEPQSNASGGLNAIRKGKLNEQKNPSASEDWQKKTLGLGFSRWIVNSKQLFSYQDGESGVDSNHAAKSLVVRTTKKNTFWVEF